jgi:hypothetical protein
MIVAKDILQCEDQAGLCRSSPLKMGETVAPPCIAFGKNCVLMAVRNGVMLIQYGGSSATSDEAQLDVGLWALYLHMACPAFTHKVENSE